MTGAFSSLSAFFAMGGYALYVWLSVACTLVPLALLAWHSRVQHRRLLRGLQTRHQRGRG